MRTPLSQVFASSFHRPSLMVLAALCIAFSGSKAALALAPTDGDLVIADTTGSRLIRVNFAGGVADVLASGGLLNGNSGVAINRVTGAIYTTNQLNTGGPGLYGRIIRVDTPTLTQTLVADGRGTDGVFTGVNGSLRYPRHLSFEKNGTLVVAERNAAYSTESPRNGIVRFNPANTNFDTNTSDVRVGTFADPTAIVASPQGSLFLGDFSGTNNLWYVPANGASQTVLDGLIVNDVATVGGLTIGATDTAGHATTLFVAEFGAARVSRIDLVYSGDSVVGGLRTLISTGTLGNPFSVPTGISYDSNTGFLYAVDNAANGVYRIANPFGAFLAGNTTYLDIIAASGGAITGASFDPNAVEVFYFTPVPEPSTLALLGLGVVGMAANARRRRRAAA